MELGLLDLGLCRVDPLRAHLDDLSYREQADHHRELLKSVFQLHQAKGEPLRAAHRGDAEQGDDDAEHPGHQPLEQVPAGHGADHGQGEQADGEILLGTEPQRHLRQGGRDEDKGQDGQHRAPEGIKDAHAQCLARLTALRHRRTVKGGGHGGGSPGDLQQDGGDQAAGGPAHIQPDQHPDTVYRRHAVGERKAQGHRHGGSQSWDGAEDDPDHHSGQDQTDGKWIDDGQQTL